VVGSGRRQWVASVAGEFIQFCSKDQPESEHNQTRDLTLRDKTGEVIRALIIRNTSCCPKTWWHLLDFNKSPERSLRESESIIRFNNFDSRLLNSSQSSTGISGITFIKTRPVPRALRHQDPDGQHQATYMSI
jgi:hypothetical protein